MTYVIPLAILLGAGLIWPAFALISKIHTEPNAWNWNRIYWISAIILWYIAGRHDQQGTQTKQRKQAA